MSARVLRSVKVVVQNDTSHELFVNGAATLKGSWAARMEPRQGAAIASSACGEFQTESTRLGSGTSGFVRLGSSRGHTTVTWSLPWTGPFVSEVATPDGLAAAIFVIDDEPDAVVMRVALNPASPAK